VRRHTVDPHGRFQKRAYYGDDLPALEPRYGTVRDETHALAIGREIERFLAPRAR